MPTPKTKPKGRRRPLFSTIVGADWVASIDGARAEGNAVSEVIRARVAVRRRHVFMFQPRFASLVFEGKKQTTIRPPRRRAVAVGDVLDLRAWMGRPYRSKQRKLREVRCESVEAIIIHQDGIEYAPGTLRAWFVGVHRQDIIHVMARADGFSSWPVMRDWFEAMHGLPFTGTLYSWKAAQS